MDNPTKRFAFQKASSGYLKQIDISKLLSLFSKIQKFGLLLKTFIEKREVCYGLALTIQS